MKRDKRTSPYYQRMHRYACGIAEKARANGGYFWQPENHPLLVVKMMFSNGYIEPEPVYALWPPLRNLTVQRWRLTAAGALL